MPKLRMPDSARWTRAYGRGMFSWPEWTEALAEPIRTTALPGDADPGDIYYRQWLDASETLVVRKGLARHEKLHALEHAWERAAARTPHGRPIELGADDRAPEKRNPFRL